MIPLEIERKFLISQTDELDVHCCGRLDIEQIYLIRSDPSVQRRIRSVSSADGVRYYYTEKRFISPSVREEDEREIGSGEYERLYAEKDPDIDPVVKTRRILVYRGQRFEIDSYPFCDTLATIELELESEEQEIIFPPYLDVIKEVTGDGGYSNASLANNRRFP
ncbi:MAG: hypothetical protein NC120_12000 [Ruminococcus sp.]|nr:hypothetical protein [Ruminococcus sp.]